MGKTKKLLSVFLAVLMVLSSITVGFTAFAADEIKTYDGLDENHQALAAALQNSYVVNADNYKKAASYNYVAYDNKDGDIAKAADALYKCLQSYDNDRHGVMVSNVETKLKAAMGKDYKTDMNKALGFLCGYGSVSKYSSNATNKLTVNTNIDMLLEEYKTFADVPKSIDDKAVLYTYIQTGSNSAGYSTTADVKVTAAAMTVFHDFAKYYSAEAQAKDINTLTKTELDNYNKNGQTVINDAKLISADNIKKFFGDSVTFETAQAYLDHVLVLIAQNGYVADIAAIGSEIDGKDISEYNFDQLKALKKKLDAAKKTYDSYVKAQKDDAAVKEANKTYNTYVTFYKDSFNYNTYFEYKAEIDKIEKYADESYSFTEEELPDVKALLDNAEKVYKKFLTPLNYQPAKDSKAVYDKALANYTKAYNYYNELAYNEAIDAFVAALDNPTVLNIPQVAEVIKKDNVNIVDDTEGSILNAERSFTKAINALFNSKKVSNRAKAIEKIRADVKAKIGNDVFEEKNAEEIISWLYAAPALSSPTATSQTSVQIEEPYLFKYASVEELLIPDEITYKMNQFGIKNANTSYAECCVETESTLTDENAQGAFSAFVNLFTDELLNTDIENTSFDELSLIIRKAFVVLNNMADFKENEIVHFLGTEKYPAVQEFYSRCESVVEQKFNSMIDAVCEKYGNRDVTAEEAKAFAAEASAIDSAYTKLTDAVKESEAVVAQMEKLNELRVSITVIIDKADADAFVELAKAFQDKYPEKNLDMSIYDAFNADITSVLDFYNGCSEAVKTMDAVVKAFEDLSELNAAMDAIFRASRFEDFKKVAPEKLNPLYTGDLENAQVKEFSAFDIANIKQIMAEINKIYGDLSDESRIDELVVNYMAVVSKLQERITLLTNPPEFRPYTVEYPANTTPAQVQNIITRLDNVIAGDLIESLLGQPLDEAIDGLLGGLLTGDIVTTLVKALFPMVADAAGDLAGIAGMIGLCVLPRTLAPKLVHYPSVKAALAAAGDDWNAVDWELCDWVNSKGVPVKDIETFIDALGEALSGILPVLNALLNGKGVGIVGIPGNQGYEKDVLPLLELLGCDESNGLKTTAEFNAVMSDVPQMLKYIINPLLDRVKELLRENTVSELLNIVTNLSYVVSNDMLYAGFADLVSPLNSLINLVNTLKDAGIDLTNLIGTINGLLGSTGITLPVLNWAEFAGIGTYHTDGASLRPSGVRNYIDATEPDVLVQLLYYVHDVINANKDAILGLLGDSLSPEIKDIIVKALSRDKKLFAGALIQLLTPYDAPDYTWPAFDYSKTNIKYSSYTSAEVKTAVDKISSILNNAIALLLDGSLNDLIGGALYTGDTAQMLFSAIYGLLDDPTIAMIFSLISVTDADGNTAVLDISKDAVADNMKSDFPKVAKAIRNAENISSAVISAEDWGIENETDFANAIAAIAAPVAPVLTALLAGKGMTVSIADGAVQLYGANGYNNAVKPLLDALTCSTLSSAEFNAQAKADSKNTILNVLNPIFGLVKSIADDPLNAVIDIIPHISLFIDNNGIQTAVEQFLAPLNNILGAIGSLLGTDNVYTWLVDELLSGIIGKQLNWNNLQNQIIPLLNQLLSNIEIDENTTISLKLNAIDWGKFAGCLDKKGTAFTTNVSDSTVTAIDYIWNTVKANAATIKALLKSALGDDYNAVSQYVDKLLAISSDRLIKVLIDLTKGLDASSFKADWSFLYRNYAAASVSLPNGVTAADLTESVEILTKAINNAMGILLDSSLVQLVGGVLYTDDLITTLAKAVYGLGDDETFRTVLGVLGVDLSKEAIASSLKKDYPAVAKAIQNSKSLSKLDTSKWNWNVKDKASFAKALTAALRPFAPALNVLLNSGSLNIADVVDFKGSNGYENAVKPLLDALGCSTVSAAQYKADANKNADNLLLNIINPLLNQVDAILADPVNMVASILPQAANFIDKGGVQYAVENLLYPVTNLINPVVSIFTNESVFTFLLDVLGLDINWKNIHNEIIPMLNSSVLGSIEIGGKKLALTLPEINWRTLAGCGTVSGKSIKADTNKELLVLIRYIFKALEANQAAVMSLAGNNATVNQIIKNVIKCGPDKVVQIVVNILLKMKTVNNASWSFRDILPTAVGYTENLTKEDFVTILEQIDPMINDLLADFAGQSLNDLVTNLVYTNNIVNTLAELVYTNLEKLDIGVDINTVLSLLGVDISTKAVSEAVKDYKSASKAIAKYAKWSDVKFDNVNWGFKDGDRDGFVNALTAVLRPLFPVLRAVLSADDLIVLDAITVKGGNGYNMAIIPIAEALGISPDALVSVKTYTDQADSDKLLTSILNPLLDKVEAILASPVSNLAEILPNLAYFAANDGIYNAAMNLIKPVTNILDEIAPIYKINLDLSMLKNLDLAGLVNSLLSSVKINGKSLNIKLSNIDLMTLAGRGGLEEYQSARTYNGSRMTAKRVVADKPAVLISVLRYIVSNLKTNLDAINGLLAGLDISDDILEIINTVLEALATEDVDAVIELLADLLFDIKSGELVLQPEDNTIKDQFVPFVPGNFYWVYWVILAATAAIIGLCLFFILRKKKEEDTDNVEVR